MVVVKRGISGHHMVWKGRVGSVRELFRWRLILGELFGAHCISPVTVGIKMLDHRPVKAALFDQIYISNQNVGVV